MVVICNNMLGLDPGGTTHNGVCVALGGGGRPMHLGIQTREDVRINLLSPFCSLDSLLLAIKPGERRVPVPLFRHLRSAWLSNGTYGQHAAQNPSPNLVLLHFKTTLFSLG